MSFERKRRRRDEQPPCDELGPDDGIDPRYLNRPSRDTARDHRKTRQLCAQAARALHLALAGGARDPLLSEFHVVDVEPAPDARRLRVVLEIDPAVAPRDHVLDRLHAASGLLRAAVAESIRRRRAPELVFDVRPSRTPDGEVDA